MKTSSFLTLIALGALASSAHAAVTASNLLAYYNFDGQSNDQSGNAPNATLTAGAVIGAGGTGYTGGGADGALDTSAVGTASAIVPVGTHFDSSFDADTMTATFWLFNNANKNSSALWVNSPLASANFRGFQSHTPWSNGTVFFDTAGCCTANTQRISGATSAIIGEWQHWVVTKDGADKEIFINGISVLSGTGAVPLLPFDGQLTIGNEFASTANNFDGRIDEFAIWDAVLTTDEIAALAGGASTLSIIVPEPSGTILGLLGLLTLGLRRRR